ncbi:MAG: GNAT family N-acetyltransferase [Oligoflexus sp.]
MTQAVDTPNILIRSAMLQDVSEIARVHVKSWQSSYKHLMAADYLSKLQLDERIAFWSKVLQDKQTASHTYVALRDDDGTVIGFCHGGPSRHPAYATYGEIYAIYLLSDFQGKEIGRCLFQRSMIKFRQDSYAGALLWVLADNPACGFYQKMGGAICEEKFEEIGGAKLKEVLFVWDQI